MASSNELPQVSHPEAKTKISAFAMRLGICSLLKTLIKIFFGF
jgi:hypothetical protein